MTDARWMRAGAALTGGLMLAAPTALAQHADDFESGYNASADGVIITGQQGYYIPVPDSEDGLVFTYAGNTIGVADNPSGGGDNFVGSIGGDPADPDEVPFARSQKNVPYSGGAFRISYDLYVTKQGDTITNQNVGSFSTQLMSQNTFTLIDLVTWTDPNDTTQGWSGSQVWFTETNVQVTEAIPEFANLALNKWYRRSTTFGIDTNRILEISITDLDTMETTTVLPVDRYQLGGPGGDTEPTGFRFFAGCSTDACTAGNTIAWDNLDITEIDPVGSCCIPESGVCEGPVTREECDDLVGVFNGIGTDCESTECFQRGPDGWFVDAPFVWSGDTCDLTDDCDLEEDVEDEQWVVTIPYSEEWTFSLCGSQTEFDTILYLGDDASGGGCTSFVMDNDGCEGELSSEIKIALEPGTYYLTLEGEIGSCGDFVLAVSAPCDAPDVERPADAEDEPEVCGENANGGCNNDPGQEEFTDLACGQTYWGSGFFETPTRDTDWYQIEIPAGPDVQVRVCGQAQFDGVFGIIQYNEGQEGSGNCDDITGFITPLDSTFPCFSDGGDTDWIVETTLSPGTWWFFAGAAFNDPVVCGTKNSYSIQLSCGACVPSLDGDVNFDDCTDFDDLLIVLSKWGDCGPEGDSDCDGDVDFDDLLNVLGGWSDEGECK